MAKGSEQPTWAWSHGNKVCGGCNKTCTLGDVRVFHQQGDSRAIFCVDCFPEKWSEWMRSHA